MAISQILGLIEANEIAIPNRRTLGQVSVPLKF